MLNLFGYTGGATLACAAAGASVCHVDASKGMVAWARENAALSGLDSRPIRWIVDDCGKFVQREARRESCYDAIIMDPPSYGRGPSGEVWKLEDSIFALIESCSAILSEQPLFVAVNSYTTGLSPAVMEYMLRTMLCPRLRRPRRDRPAGTATCFARRRGQLLACRRVKRRRNPVLRHGAAFHRGRKTKLR